MLGLNNSKLFFNTTEEVANEISKPVWTVIEVGRYVLLVVLGVFMVISVLNFIYGQKQNNGDAVGVAKKNIIASVVGIGVVIAAVPFLGLLGINPPS